MDVVYQNYYYKRSVTVINGLLFYAYDPKIYINKYMKEIKELLGRVDAEHQQQTINLVKKET